MAGRGRGLTLPAWMTNQTNFSTESRSNNQEDSSLISLIQPASQITDSTYVINKPEITTPKLAESLPTTILPPRGPPPIFKPPPSMPPMLQFNEAARPNPVIQVGLPVQNVLPISDQYFQPANSAPKFNGIQPFPLGNNHLPSL